MTRDLYRYRDVIRRGHPRQRALAAGKPAHYRYCTRCHQYDNPSNMAVRNRRYNTMQHRECRNREERRQRRAKTI